MRLLVFILLLSINLFSNNSLYPKTFFQMGEPLFSIVNQFEHSSADSKTIVLITNYRSEVNKTIQIGLKADKLNSSDKDKKEYLFALRKLQKHYDFILDRFRKELFFNIQQTNHHAVKEILNKDFSNAILKRSSLLKHTLDYYKTYKEHGKIPVLDKILANQKNQNIILDSNKRFINHGRYVLDTKTGLSWQRNGYESGRLNYFQAKIYAERLSLNNLKDWRLPTIKELLEIYEEKDDIPFIYAPFLKNKTAYWSSQRSYSADDYAYLFIWPEGNKKAGPNGCYASKNWYYVRAVHDPVN